MASFRLNKVAKDFNVGIQTLVEYLAKKGHQVEPVLRLWHFRQTDLLL